MMQNIDPLYFLTPIVVIAFSVGLLVYWRFKRNLSKWSILYSLIAYAGAIALKYVVQILTLNRIVSAFGSNPVILGLYFGAQVAAFEVGGAFLVAVFASSRRHLKAKDAEGYGLGLAFWENGIYIGGLTLINYILYYAILSTPNSATAETLHLMLLRSAPGLFFGSSRALPLIGYTILERVASLLAHFSWGYLVVLAAVYKKRTYLAVAFPIGFLIDFLTPFSSRLGIELFELLIFVVAAAGLLTALATTRGARKRMKVEEQTLGKSSQSSPAGSSQSLDFVTFKRAIGYGRVYLIIGIIISVLIGATLAGRISSGTLEGSSASLLIGGIPALAIPLGAVIGSMGSLMVFTSDKAKGVFEYLIAYGVNVSAIFWSIVVAAIGLVTIVLAISVSGVIVVLLAFGAGLSYSFVELLIYYAVPISYTGTIFMSMVGMIWSSLATRRTGLNSPVGVAPILGFLPMLMVLVISSRVGGSLLLLVGSVSLASLLLVGAMVGISSSKMQRERFLSNA